MDLEPSNVKNSIGSKVEMLENFNFDFFLWPWLRESHKNLQERRVLCRLRDPPASANENRAEGQDALPRVNGQRFVLFKHEKGRSAAERAESRAFYG